MPETDNTRKRLKSVSESVQEASARADALWAEERTRRMQGSEYPQSAPLSSRMQGSEYPQGAPLSSVSGLATRPDERLVRPIYADVPNGQLPPPPMWMSSQQMPAPPSSAPRLQSLFDMETQNPLPDGSMRQALSNPAMRQRLSETEAQQLTQPVDLRKEFQLRHPLAGHQDVQFDNDPNDPRSSFQAVVGRTLARAGAGTVDSLTRLAQLPGAVGGYVRDQLSPDARIDFTHVPAGKHPNAQHFYREIVDSLDPAMPMDQAKSVIAHLMAIPRSQWEGKFAPYTETRTGGSSVPGDMIRNADLMTGGILSSAVSAKERLGIPDRIPRVAEMVDLRPTSELEATVAGPLDVASEVVPFVTPLPLTKLAGAASKAVGPAAGKLGAKIGNLFGNTAEKIAGKIAQAAGGMTAFLGTLGAPDAIQQGLAQAARGSPELGQAYEVAKGFGGAGIHLFVDTLKALGGSPESIRKIVSWDKDKIMEGWRELTPIALLAATHVAHKAIDGRSTGGNPSVARPVGRPRDSEGRILDAEARAAMRPQQEGAIQFNPSRRGIGGMEAADPVLGPLMEKQVERQGRIQTEQQKQAEAFAKAEENRRIVEAEEARNADIEARKKEARTMQIEREIAKLNEQGKTPGGFLRKSVSRQIAGLQAELQALKAPTQKDLSPTERVNDVPPLKFFANERGEKTNDVRGFGEWLKERSPELQSITNQKKANSFIKNRYNEFYDQIGERLVEPSARPVESTQQQARPETQVKPPDASQTTVVAPETIRDANPVETEAPKPIEAIKPVDPAEQAKTVPSEQAPIKAANPSGKMFETKPKGPLPPREIIDKAKAGEDADYFGWLLQNDGNFRDLFSKSAAAKPQTDAKRNLDAQLIEYLDTRLALHDRHVPIIEKAAPVARPEQPLPTERGKTDEGQGQVDESLRVRRDDQRREDAPRAQRPEGKRDEGQEVRKEEVSPLPEVPTKSQQEPSQASPEPAEPVREAADISKTRSTKNTTPEQIKSLEDDGRVVRWEKDDIHVDPIRLQYKLNINSEGVTDSGPRNVTRFDRNKGGVISVWRDPENGKVYVVNGHHRVSIAKGDPSATSLDIRFIKADTAAEARAEGALMNIAEGRGTAIDAAKFFRDTQSGPEALREGGLDMKAKLVQDALELTKLDNTLFNKVVQGELKESHGAIIGKMIPNHADQKALETLLSKRKGKDLPDDVLREVIEDVQGAPKIAEKDAKGKKPEGGDIAGQAMLWGDVGKSELNLSVEKARVILDIQRKLARLDRRLRDHTKDEVKDLLEDKDIARDVDTERARTLSEEARLNLADFKLRRRHAGPIADALNQAARDIMEKGYPRQQAMEAAYERIVTELKRPFSEAEQGRASEGRQGSDAPRQPEQAVGEGAGAETEGVKFRPGLWGQKQVEVLPMRGEQGSLAITEPSGKQVFIDEKAPPRVKDVEGQTQLFGEKPVEQAKPAEAPKPEPRPRSPGFEAAEKAIKNEAENPEAVRKAFIDFARELPEAAKIDDAKAEALGRARWLYESEILPHELYLESLKEAGVESTNPKFEKQLDASLRKLRPGGPAIPPFGAGMVGGRPSGVGKFLSERVGENLDKAQGIWDTLIKGASREIRSQFQDFTEFVKRYGNAGINLSRETMAVADNTLKRGSKNFTDAQRLFREIREKSGKTMFAGAKSAEALKHVTMLTNGRFTPDMIPKSVLDKITDKELRSRVLKDGSDYLPNRFRRWLADRILEDKYPNLKEYPDKLRAVLNNGYDVLNRVGAKRWVYSKKRNKHVLIPIRPSKVGFAIPENLNKEGMKLLKEAAERGLNDPASLEWAAREAESKRITHKQALDAIRTGKDKAAIDSWAKQQVASGQYETVPDALRALKKKRTPPSKEATELGARLSHRMPNTYRTPQDAMAALARYYMDMVNGVNHYYDSARIQLPNKYVKLGEETMTEGFFIRNGYRVEAADMWGIKYGKKGGVGFPRLDKGIAALNLDHRLLPKVKMFFDHYLGSGIDRDPSSKFWNMVTKGEALTKLGFSTIGAIRNALESFTKSSQPMYVKWQMLKEYPPFLNMLFPHSKRARERVAESMTISGMHGMVLDPQLVGSVSKSAMFFFQSGTKGSAIRAGIGGQRTLEYLLDKVVKTQKNTPLKNFLIYGLRGDFNPEQSARRQLRKQFTMNKMSNAELASRLGREPTLAEYGEAIRRSVIDSDFPRTLANTSLNDATSPVMRAVTLFARWGVKKGQQIYQDVIREAGHGNVAPLGRYLFAHAMIGEMYNLTKSIFTDRHSSLVRQYFDDKDDDVYDWARAAARMLLDGSAIPIIADMTYGIGDFVAGPTIGTLKNMLKSGSEVATAVQRERGIPSAIEMTEIFRRLAAKEIPAWNKIASLFKQMTDKPPEIPEKFQHLAPWIKAARIRAEVAKFDEANKDMWEWFTGGFVDALRGTTQTGGPRTVLNAYAKQHLDDTHTMINSRGQPLSEPDAAMTSAIKAYEQLLKSARTKEEWGETITAIESYGQYSAPMSSVKAADYDKFLSKYPKEVAQTMLATHKQYLRKQGYALRKAIANDKDRRKRERERSMQQRKAD